VELVYVVKVFQEVDLRLQVELQVVVELVLLVKMDKLLLFQVVVEKPMVEQE
tara:strand:+ start:86 stop:241 length:156 start_codon:yes stop_codon:yes gene_type:complete